MGKAFSDEEKELINENIKKEAFELFRKNGIRKTTIGDITKKVGIAQGGFYTFYKNKEELFYDIIDDDMDVQIQHCLYYLDKCDDKPQDTLYKAIKHNCMHMQENRAMWLDEPDIMEILNRRKSEEVNSERDKFKSVIEKMSDYWIKNKRIISMDKDKLVSLFMIARTMYINKECCINDDDFDEIFEDFIINSINKYIKTK